MSDATIVYLVLAGVVAAFIVNKFPVELVAICGALALYLSDVLTVEQILAGFGNPTVIFIASLFVMSEAMEATGVTAWASQQLTQRAGESPTRLLVLTMALVAVMSALITPNGAVAALVPVVVVLALRMGKSPSEMLLPMCFASFSGALFTLTGSPVNVIVSEASHEAGGGGFGFFEFGIVGVPLFFGTVAIAVFLGPRLLPRRKPQSMPADFSQHARMLLAQYSIEDRVYRLQVLRDSPLIGLTDLEIDLAAYPSLTVISAQEAGVSGPVGRSTLEMNDFLVLRGSTTDVDQFAAANRLEKARLVVSKSAEDLFTRESGVAEVVIPPRSTSIGETVFPGMVTDSGDLVILAVSRSGEERPRKTVLAAGDTLLLRGRWEALDENLSDPNVLVVDEPDRIRRQLVPLGPRAKVTLAVMAGMVALLATGIIAPAIATLLAATSLLLLRVITVQQAYRAISWTIVILIGAMIPLSTAMTTTGAADDIASLIVDSVGGGSPYLLIIALFVLVAIMGQILSNTATALIVIPIAVAAALELDVSVQPVLMAVNVASSASFLTPIATTPNLMVLEPGGYRFGDYWKFGLPLMALYFVVAIVLVPLVWRF